MQAHVRLEGYCSLIRSKFVSKNCNFPSVLHLINTFKQVLEKELSLLSHFIFLAKVSSIWSKQSGHLTIVKMILKGKPWNVSLYNQSLKNFNNECMVFNHWKLANNQYCLINSLQMKCWLTFNFSDEFNIPGWPKIYWDGTRDLIH